MSIRLLAVSGNGYTHRGVLRQSQCSRQLSHHRANERRYPAYERLSLQRGKFVTFTAYCVGSINNNIVWQVNSVTGGGTATGTIVPGITGSALYTAPAAMPMSGNTVTVTSVCRADPTKTASTTVTLIAQ